MTSRSRAGGPELVLTLAVCAVLSACVEPNARSGIEGFLTQDSIGHLEGDADLLASLVADTVISVDGGSVRLMTREDIRTQFADYFSSTRIVGWDEADPPRVHISPSGTAASINRAVRQTRELRGTDGAVVTDTVVIAWTAYLEREAREWRMKSVGTTWRPRNDGHTRILRGARRATGRSPAPSEGPAAMRFHARVTWTGEPYEVEVLSAPDGSTQLTFMEGPTFSVSPSSRWAEMRPDSFTALSDTMETFARGHDFFLGLLYPESRLANLNLAGLVHFEGRPALLVTGRDALGGVVSLYYGRSDSLPLGFQVQDHLRGREPVTTTLDDWRETEGRRAPWRVRFEQGEEIFDYQMLRVEALSTPATEQFERGAR